jgi:hypothetical protein
MDSRALRQSVLPVLYVGSDMTRAAYESLRSHRIGVVIADDARRAKRVLSHFRVAAIVFAVPDLPGVDELSKLGIPLVVLAARETACDHQLVTILPRNTDPEELAAVIHGVVRREPATAAAA